MVRPVPMLWVCGDPLPPVPVFERIALKQLEFPAIVFGVVEPFDHIDPDSGFPLNRDF